MTTVRSTDRSTPRVGDVIDGRYELRRDLGRRESGRVFEATHLFTGRSVALKLVTQTSRAAAATLELRARLEREAHALASVRHPGVVEVLDGGALADGSPYIVLQMIEGRTLEGLLAARGRISREDTIALALQLSFALEAAHRAGVVHRNVEPANIIIARDHQRREVVKLVGFGLARLPESKEKVTGIGALIGTPSYMAPEQLLALDDVDNRCDIYALGIVMFECLAGRLPYEGAYQDLLLSVCSTEPTVPLDANDAEVPAPLRAVVLKAMQKEPRDRFWWMKDLTKALRDAFPGARDHTQIFSTPPPLGGVAPPAEQRRRVARAPYVTPVRITIGDVTIDGRTEDISTGGLLVVCNQVCPVGARGVLRCALPIEGLVVSLDVSVRWVRAARENDPLGPRALGLEFASMPENVTRSIERYVTLMENPE